MSREPGYRSLTDDAARRALKYLESLATRPVAPDPAGVKGLAAWDTPLPDGPTDGHEVLKLLDEVGTPATMAMGSPRFFGFVIGGALPVTVAANWIATAWDQNTGLYAATPATSELERISLGWLTELLGLPQGSGGSFVTGAAVANFVALAAARHAVLERAGWDVEARGLFGAPEITVVVSAEAHPTVTKALGLLGLGRERVIAVPVDEQGRMRADAFPKLSGPAIVCVQAGNVNTGSIDPIADIIPRAKAAQAWVHVDGAFGLWANAVPELRARVAGVGEADSWATDAHKWLNVPYDSGLAFVRDAATLRATLAIHAAYLPTGAPRDPSHYTPELSRRARGVEVWTALRSLGRSGVAGMIGGTCRHARRFAAGLSAAGYEILNDVVLNQVLVSFGTPEETERTIALIQKDGTCWCGGTHWQGRTAMRISVSCWATTDADVEQSLAAMIRCAKAARG